MANEPVQYLNADLDVESSGDLRTLAAAFELRELPAVHVMPWVDNTTRATFEAREQHDEPEPSITAMMNVIESLPENLRALWDQCSLREFNIGYRCGCASASKTLNQGLSVALLGRMAAVGASLRITLYPADDEGRELGRVDRTQHESS